MASYDDHANHHFLTEALLQLPAVVGQPDPGEPPMTQQVRRIDQPAGQRRRSPVQGKGGPDRAISRVKDPGNRKSAASHSRPRASRSHPSTTPCPKPWNTG